MPIFISFLKAQILLMLNVILNNEFKEKLDEKYKDKIFEKPYQCNIIGKCWKSDYDTEDHEKRN